MSKNLERVISVMRSGSSELLAMTAGVVELAMRADELEAAKERDAEIQVGIGEKFESAASSIAGCAQQQAAQNGCSREHFEASSGWPLPPEFADATISRRGHCVNIQSLDGSHDHAAYAQELRAIIAKLQSSLKSAQNELKQAREAKNAAKQSMAGLRGTMQAKSLSHAEEMERQQQLVCAITEQRDQIFYQSALDAEKYRENVDEFSSLAADLRRRLADESDSVTNLNAELEKRAGVIQAQRDQISRMGDDELQLRSQVNAQWQTIAKAEGKAKDDADTIRGLRDRNEILSRHAGKLTDELAASRALCEQQARVIAEKLARFEPPGPPSR